MDKIDYAVMRAEEHFRSGFNCAESVLLATAEYLGIEDAAIPRIATPFGGGIARSQYACGAVTGGAMAIGILLGRDMPKGDRTRADSLTQRYIRWFEEDKGAVNCRDLAGVDFSDPDQNASFRAPGGAHSTVCVPLVSDAVRALCGMIQQEGHVSP